MELEIDRTQNKSKSDYEYKKFSAVLRDQKKSMATSNSATEVSRVKAWALATRPKTLVAAVLPVVVAAVFARYQLEMEVPLWIPGLALFVSLLIQVATNWINDAKDFEKGADGDNRLGPARAAAQGWILPSTLQRAALGALVLAVASSFALVLEGGWPIVFIGILSCLMAYAYTGGPFPLAYKGLGEVFVFLFFGLVPVGGILWILGLRSSQDWLVQGPMLFDLGAILGCLNVALILVNNLRDRNQDALNRKHTLVVRLGEAWSHRLFACVVAVPYVIVVSWALAEKKPGFLLPLLALPVAVSVVFQVVTQPPSRKFNSFLALTSVHSLVFCSLLCVVWVMGLV